MLDKTFIIYKAIIASILFVTFASFNLLASTADFQVEQKFEDANKFYKEKSYQKAIKLYKEIISEGYTSCELYYNLGNAYFKSDSNAKAILYFEKSLSIEPADEDARYNLQLANARIIDKPDVVPELVLTTVGKQVFKYFTVKQWATLFLSVFVVTLVLFSAYLFSKKVWIQKVAFYSGLVSIILSITLFAITLFRNNEVNSNEFGIIMADVVNLKSAPEQSGKDIITIHAGLKVRILESSGDWISIKLPNNSVGWIQNFQIEAI